MDSATPPASGQNSASNPVFSGPAPTTNPFSGQNSIPSSATGDVVVSSDKPKPKKGLIIAIAIIAIIAIGATIATLLFFKNSSLQSESNNNSNSTMDVEVATEREAAIALYERMESFLEEFLWKYNQAPELAETFIEEEVGAALESYDDDAIELISGIAHYYQENTERLRILKENGCIVNSKIDNVCVNAIRSNAESDAGLSDIENYMSSTMEEIKNSYEKIRTSLDEVKKENG